MSEVVALGAWPQVHARGAVDLGDEEAREETGEEDEAHSVVYVWSVFTMKRIGASC